MHPPLARGVGGIDPVLGKQEVYFLFPEPEISARANHDRKQFLFLTILLLSLFWR